MFSVGATKSECWMYIMLMGCDVPAPVKDHYESGSCQQSEYLVYQ